MHPLPDTRFPLNASFPLEYGVDGVFTDMLKTGIISPAYADLFPRGHTKDEYIEMAQWFRLPSRVAYCEGGFGGTTRKDLVVWVTQEAEAHITMPISGYWNALVDEVRAKLNMGEGNLPFQLSKPEVGQFSKNTLPEFMLVHDLDARSAAVVSCKEFLPLLNHSVRWAPPGAKGTPQSRNIRRPDFP